MSGQQSAHAPDCASYDFDPEKQLGLDKPCDCGAAVDLRCVACPACGVAIGEACLDSAGAGRTCLRRTAAALRFNANVNDETCGQRTAALSEGATYWCMKQKGHEGTEHEAMREDGTVYFWRCSEERAQREQEGANVVSGEIQVRRWRVGALHIDLPDCAAHVLGTKVGVTLTSEESHRLFELLGETLGRTFGAKSTEHQGQGRKP